MAKRNRQWEKMITIQLEELFGPGEVAVGEGEIFGSPGPTIEMPYFWAESAYGELASLEDTLDFARYNCDLPRPVMAICQRPGQEPVAAMFLEEFLGFLEELFEIFGSEEEETEDE